jgi:PmbA protein
VNKIDRILDKCVRSGAAMAEVYNLSQKQTSITVRDGKVEMINKATPGGTAIRYFTAEKSSFAHTTDTSDAVVDELIAKLVNLAKKTAEEEKVTLPNPESDPDNLDIYSTAFADSPTETKIEYLIDLEQRALKYDPSIKQSNGMDYTETISSVSIANTNGVSKSYDSTLYTVAIKVAAVKNNEMYPGEEEYSARYFDDLPSPDELVEKVAGMAVRLVGGTPVDPGDYEIIFTPNVAGTILFGIAYALKGNDYLKDISFLAGKEGTQFADSRLTIYNNAIMPRGISTWPFDDEGSPSANTTVVENGIFKTALYDTQTATKAGKKSTASSSREDYSKFPDIWPGNLYIAAGTDKANDIIASCKKGIIVEGAHGWGLNSVTGQYSAGINGTLVRNGRRIKPVANVTLAASTDDLFKGIAAIGDDLTFYRSLNMPTIMIKKMKIGA